MISGRAKGIQIEAPKGENTRPTTDRVKESLFNIINHLLKNAVVLDLFSGSGSLGIEALSRGASRSYMCDQNSKAVSTIKKNIAHCGLEEGAEVFCCDYKQALKKLEGEQMTLIFLDPPYGKGLLQDAIAKIFDGNMLTDDGIIVAEHPRNEELAYPGVVRTEKYGDICISFLKKVVSN